MRQISGTRFKPPSDAPGGFAASATRPETLGGTRPFILSTPHHSLAWVSAGASETSRVSQLEAALAQIEQAITACEAEIAQLDMDYRHVLAEYEAAAGRRGGV